MIYPTSVPYAIETYEVVTTPLYADGTPRVGKETRQRQALRFPQEVMDRIHSMTDSPRFRRFLAGAPFSGMDLGWLFLCLETSVPYRTASALRDSSELDVEQWGFYTFDDERLNELHAGGKPPDVDVFSFSDRVSARRALSVMGAPDLVSEMNLRADRSYVLFAQYLRPGNETIGLLHS